MNAVTTGYDLSRTDSQEIAERVEACLVNDSYLFPRLNDVSTRYLPVNFVVYLWSRVADERAGL